MSELKTLRNADIRRVDMQDFNNLMSHKSEYEEQFYSYDIKDKTYSELIDFFTSNKAFVGHFGGTNAILLCIAKAYYKGRLTGIETVPLVYKKDVNGASIFVYASETFGRVSSGHCLNDTMYDIINHRIINLQFDASCRVRYTNRYLKGDFRPFDIHVSEMYGRFPNSVISGGSKVKSEDQLRLRKMAFKLNERNIITSISPDMLQDISFTEDSSFLRWRKDID